MTVVRVCTGSRLHFGLLHPAPLPRDAFWSDLDGHLTIPARAFGGVGVMIEEPALQVKVEPTTSWSAEGPLARRALTVAQRWFENNHGSCPALRIVVESAGQEHVGLGMGTQLSLAVAKAISASCDQPTLTATELARRINRGERSGIGIHGFDHGGLIVDGGRREGIATAPLMVANAVPEEWRFVLASPRDMSGLSGTAEGQAFTALSIDASVRLAEVLCRLLLMGILPALTDGDVRAFGAALTDYNARSGEAYASVQGGRYRSLVVRDLVNRLRELGAYGVGQSSWGPTTFGLFADSESAGAAERKLASADLLLWSSPVRNRPAHVEYLDNMEVFTPN
jgi:beta-RFAP synthase